MKTIKKENGDTNLVEEKTGILKKALESIDLGLGEAQVCLILDLVYIVRNQYIQKIIMSLFRVCTLSEPNCSTG